MSEENYYYSEKIFQNKAKSFKSRELIKSFIFDMKNKGCIFVYADTSSMLFYNCYLEKYEEYDYNLKKVKKLG